MKILERAHWWLAQGVPPTPVHPRRKDPIQKEWQNSSVRESDIAMLFGNNNLNLGIRTGGVVDVDLDSPFAQAIADEVLPPTRLRWGRKSAPNSHRLYRVSRAVTRKFKAASTGMIVEIRADGCQSLSPPSVHPSGELYEFEEEGEACEVGYGDLLKCVSFLAAIALWAALGDDLRERRLRHEATLALTGFLLRRGLPAERCEELVTLAARAAGDEEVEDRVKAVRTTVAALSAEKKVTGRPRLVEILGEAATGELTTKLVEWLSLNARAGEKSVADALEVAGFGRLTKSPSPEALEKVLRALQSEAAGVDKIRRGILRTAAIAKLSGLEVKGPAALLDAALETAALAEEREGEGTTVTFEEAVPCSEAVDGAQLLDEIVHILERFVILPEGGAVAAALWAIHSYCYDSFDVTPRLAIRSATKRCGKTRLLQILQAIVSRPLPVSNLTAAATFRAIEKFRPTLLCDEADTFLGERDELRGVLNSGHTRVGAFVARCEGEAKEVKLFSTWAPAAVAAIGRIPETLEDRSITVFMKRRAPGEEVARLRGTRLVNDLAGLRQRIVRWVKDHEAALRNADPVIPSELDDRAADNWRPLLAIADEAGGSWSEAARRVAVDLSKERDEGEGSHRVQALHDLHRLFVEKEADRLTTEQILEVFNGMEERPWPEYQRGRPLTARQLASLLKPLGIQPRNIRLTEHDVRKGYYAEDLCDSLSRYPVLSATPLQESVETTYGDTDPLQKEACSGYDSSQVFTASRCSGVADRNPPGQEKEENPAETGWEEGTV